MGERRVGEVLLLATDYLRNKGRESPRLAAEILLARTLNCDRIRVYVRFEEPISEPLLAQFRELIRRRGQAEPVAYIIGEKEFFSLRFAVNSSVLIPRPDTETLVETVLRQVKTLGLDSPRILDLGVGSGTILLSLAHSLDKGRFVGVDFSPEAIKVAETNRSALCDGKEVRFHVGNWFSALPEEEREYDVIVSNPPYIPTQVLGGLSEEIRNYEPAVALDGGADGLDAYRKIARDLGRHLAENGFSALEIGADQAEKVREIFAMEDFKTEIVKDLEGRDRVVVLRR
jgi:release factor glutamine methyltransferase